MAREDYLTLEQVCERLGRSEDEIKDLVRQGRLSEVRDAGKVLYRKAEVDAVGSKEGSSVVELDAADEAAPMEIDIDENDSFASALSSLADSSATLGALDESPTADQPPELEPAEGELTGSSIAFALDEDASGGEPEEATRADRGPAPAEPSDLRFEDIPEALPAAPAAESVEDPGFSSEIDLMPSDDTRTGIDAALPPIAHEAEQLPDLGLSGSSIISLEPGDSAMLDSPAAKEDTKVTKVGISVFDDDELDVETDPMGETQISTGVEAFDAVGSGSGLLDLTQESDDTSLGAELLDVISPTEAAETEHDSSALGAETLDEGSAVAVVPTREAAPAPAATFAAPAHRAAVGEMAGAVPLNVCLLLGFLGIALVGLATTSVLQGVWPSAIFEHLASGVVYLSVFGGLALIAAALGVVSILAGRK